MIVEPLINAVIAVLVVGAAFFLIIWAFGDRPRRPGGR